MGGPIKGRADYLELGDWNATCSMCGCKRKASQLVKNWQGFYRCPEHNEPRQPQDFARGVPDIQTPPWTQPPTETFVQICTLNGVSAIPGVGIPGCMLPGNKNWDPSLVADLGYLETETGSPLITESGVVLYG